MIKRTLLLLSMLVPFAAFSDEIINVGYEPMPGAYEHMTLDQVRTRMIKESIKEHPDCPCPYSPDHIGGNCGTDCWYYKPGGERVKCYLMDISSREIYFYKKKMAARPKPPSEDEGQGRRRFRGVIR